MFRVFPLNIPWVYHCAHHINNAYKGYSIYNAVYYMFLLHVGYLPCIIKEEHHRQVPYTIE